MLNRSQLKIERDLVRRCREELAEQSLFTQAVERDKVEIARELARGFLLSSPVIEVIRDYEVELILKAVIDDLFFLGPLEEPLADSNVTEIMVNAPDRVFIEQFGEMELTDILFEDDDHVKSIIDRIAASSGRRCDEGQPLCDCVLIRPGAPFDGSRVNAVCKGISVDHHSLNIRKFNHGTVRMERLMETGMFSQPMLEFLEAAMVGRLNFLIVGGTGSGKTTLTNGLSNFIPDSQRVIVIEDTPELKINKPNLLRHQYRPPNPEGEGEVTIRDLVKNALRERPDRIIVGECRGAEAYDMLRAISSGHVGSITTIHADDTRDAVISLRTMVQVAGFDMSSKDILDYISRCFDIIVSVERGMDGLRRITEIAEIQGMEGDQVRIAPIFRFEQDPYEGGRVSGRFAATGERMLERHLRRLARNGVSVEDWWFEC